jgi:hypothetical protein
VVILQSTADFVDGLRLPANLRPALPQEIIDDLPAASRDDLFFEVVVLGDSVGRELRSDDLGGICSIVGIVPFDVEGYCLTLPLD